MKQEKSKKMNPKFLKLKYDGRCLKCGERIPAGRSAYWDPTAKRIWHLDCQPACTQEPVAPVVLKDEGPKGGLSKEERIRISRPFLKGWA